MKLRINFKWGEGSSDRIAIQIWGDRVCGKETAHVHIYCL